VPFLDKEVTNEVMSINPKWLMVPLFSNSITNSLRRIEKSIGTKEGICRPEATIPAQGKKHVRNDNKCIVHTRTCAHTPTHS
jgi:hypothetical protein